MPPFPYTTHTATASTLRLVPIPTYYLHTGAIVNDNLRQPAPRSHRTEPTARSIRYGSLFVGFLRPGNI